MPFSVLMQSRPNLFTSPGGDTTQVRMTAERLRELGVRAEISLDYDADLSGFDLVHVFNVFYPHQTLLFARNARGQGRRVVLSPIFIVPGAIPHGNPFERGWMSWFDSFRALWPVQSLYRRCAKGSRDKAEALLLRATPRGCERRLAPLVDLALPNSPSERDLFARYFAFPVERCRVVPNGVEEDFGDCPPEDQRPWESLRGGALCVAGIMPNKNQLRLAQAARIARVPLTLVGPAPAPRYLARIRRLEGPMLRILPAQPRQALKGLYRVSRVHALASHFETTGLVNLEAALHGCAIVASDRGYMRDYLGSHAHWCDPNDVHDIARALAEAMAQPRSFAFAETVRARFTWREAARQTLAAYEHALGS